MKKNILLALTISSALLSNFSFAANQVADARGNAMGNTGVASASYLVAPFYNPALGSSFREQDDFAILIPAFSVAARDSNESYALIEDLQSAIDDFEENGDLELLEEINAYLIQLDGNSPLTISTSLGFAIAFPTQTVSTNLFSRGYAEAFALPNVVTDDYLATNMDMAGFGYAEIGLSFAKEFLIAEQKVSFGITPKYQRMSTYAEHVSISDFNLEDYKESEITANAFNLDLGVMWYYDNFRAGLAIKDLFKQEIEAETNGFNDIYKLDTQVTMGLAYYTNHVTFAFDADLTKQSRFQKLADNTQFIRMGVEGDAWSWAQLRAGYEIDLESTLDNSFTAGIGFSPFDVVHIDVAGSYAGENQVGVSANLALTF